MKDAERHLMTIFSGALARESEPERAAYLDEACGGDADLRGRVDALLRAHGQAGRFLEPCVTAGSETAAVATATANPMAGTMIGGRYKLIEEIGEGGMGTVWMAQQTEPVKRAVAVKLVKPGMDSKQVLARFEAERQALALMDHPNIARVFDGGAMGDEAGDAGRPFFVMELVKGVPITKYCDEHRLTPRQRLELFVPVCQAVQHAHQKGIIHRDIKPSNILVAQYDGRPVPKVIDFGVAKAAGQQLTDKTLMTGFGAVVGTLEYMSPEQAELNQLDIDTRSDIYSLGVVLYELLTGSTPLDRKRLKQAAFAEVLRIIREEEPPKPSTRLSGSKDSLPSVSAQRQMEPAKLTKLVRGELDWIVMKALDKDRSRRYETANGFAMDVQRYLADEPVLACPPSGWYRLRKLARKYRKVLATAAAFAGLLVLGAVVASLLAIWATLAEKEANDQRDAANTARDNESIAKKRAEANARETRRQLARVNVAYGQRIRDEGDLFGSLPWFARALSLDREDQARAEVHRFRFASVLQECPRPVLIWFPKAEPNHTEFSPDGSRVLIVADFGTWVCDAITGQLLTSLNESGNVRYASFSSDGSRIVTAGEHVSRVWDATTGAPVTPPLKHELPVWQAFFSPDGRRLLSVSRTDPPPGTRPLCMSGQARVWDPLTGAPVSPPWLISLAQRREELSRSQARFSPDSRRVLSASPDGTAAVCDVETGKRITTLKHPQGIIRVFSFSPDSQRVLTAGWNHTAQVWNATTGALITTLPHSAEVMTASFNSEGRSVITASLDGTARIWNAATGAPLISPLRHQSEVNEAWLSPDGRRVVTASWDFTARLWDAATGAALAPPLKHGAKLTQVAFGPEGRWLLTSGFDRTVRLWDTAPAAPAVPPLVHGARVAYVSYSPDGRHVVTASDDSTARVWDAATGQPVSPPLAHGKAVYSAGFSRDGRRVVTASADQTARVWDTVSGAPLSPPLKHQGPVLHASISPDGQHVVTASEDGTAQLWDVATGNKLVPPLKHGAVYGGVVRTATFSPDGRRLATAGCDGTGRVWDALTGKPVPPPLRHPGGGLWGASFSPDGLVLLTWSENHSACLWDTATGELRASLNHGSNVTHAEFTQDGQRVVTASADQTARVWHAATGQPLAPPLKHSEPVGQAWFSPDGARILTRTYSGMAQIWDARTSEPISPPLKHWGAIEHAAFSPDGSRVVTAGRDGAVRVWGLPSEDRPVDDVVRLAQVLSNQRIQEGNEAIGFVPLETAQLKSDWELLRARYAKDFAVGLEQVLSRRQRQAETSAQSGQWSAAIFHLAHLIAAQPAQWRHFAERGRAYTALQQWDKAAADYAKAIELGADDPAVREQAGAAQQQLGDFLRAKKQDPQACQAYRKAIEILQRCPVPPRPQLRRPARAQPPQSGRGAREQRPECPGPGGLSRSQHSLEEAGRKLPRPARIQGPCGLHLWPTRRFVGGEAATPRSRQGLSGSHHPLGKTGGKRPHQPRAPAERRFQLSAAGTHPPILRPARGSREIVEPGGGHPGEAGAAERPVVDHSGNRALSDRRLCESQRGTHTLPDSERRECGGFSLSGHGALAAGAEG